MSPEKRIKVCHVIIGLDVGGAERMLCRLAISQSHSKLIDPAVISLKNLGVVGKELEAAGVTVHALNWRGVFDLPSMLLRLFSTITALRPDVIQTWMYHSDLFAGIAARAAGINRIVWSIRTTELPVNAPWSTRFARWMCARLSSRIPLAIVCNAERSRRFHESIGYDRSRISVIPNGIDSERFNIDRIRAEAIRRSWAIPPGTKVVGMVGRDSPDKDPENFIAGFAGVASVRSDVVAVMVGKGFTPANMRLMKIIQSTGFGRSFVLVGEVNDVPAVLGAIDIFVLPSRTEAFPNVLVEAMAAGKPCVATDVGDVDAILGGHGRVVPSANAGAISAEVLRLLNKDESFLDEIGRKAQARVKDKFSMDTAAEKFLKQYQKLMAVE